MNGVFDEIGLSRRERYGKLTKAESVARQGDCGGGVEGDQGVFVRAERIIEVWQRWS